MARQARGEYLNPDEIQVVHAVQRCGKSKGTQLID